MKDLGKRIRELREARELTLSALATKTGITKPYLWRIERGDKTHPSLATLTKIADALGVSVADLVSDDVGAETESSDIYFIGAGSAPIEIVPQPPSDSLIKYSKMKKRRGEPLSEEEIRMLCCISYHGRQPENNSDWDYIFESIRRVLEK